MSKHDKVAKSKPWIIDLEATSHMCSDETIFTSLDYSKNSIVIVADGTETKSIGIGVGKIFEFDENGESKMFYVFRDWKIT